MLSYSVPDRSIFVHQTGDSFLFLNLLSSPSPLRYSLVRSCVNCSSPVPPTFLRGLARALDRTMPSPAPAPYLPELLSCHLLAPFQFASFRLARSLQAKRDQHHENTHLGLSSRHGIQSRTCVLIVCTAVMSTRLERAVTSSAASTLNHMVYGVSERSRDISLGSRLVSSRVVLSVLRRSIHRISRGITGTVQCDGVIS